MFPKKLLAEGSALLDACREQGWSVTAAESCTGGLVMALLTDIPGASRVIHCGYVTYSAKAKQELLGIGAGLIAACGEVSPEVSRAMAEGALARADAGLAIGVTGIAGPGGGSPEKPVGLVYVTALTHVRAETRECRFQGSRSDIRLQTVEVALGMALALCRFQVTAA